MKTRFDYDDRFYRTGKAAPGRWVAFQATVATTDLYILAARDLTSEALFAVRKAREALEEHIRRFPAFATSLQPLELPGGPLAPLLAAMYEAGRAAGVGPMAAVAGAVAACVGSELRRFSPEVIVENGGDIFLDLREDAVVGLFAGDSPFSGRIGLRVAAARAPLGICTSSGTVGPSLSFGCADAATAIAPDAALADAVATGVGNRVHGPEDLEAAVSWAMTVPGVAGAVAILGDRLAARGEAEFVQVTAD